MDEPEHFPEADVEGTVWDRFERQAVRDPDKVAVASAEHRVAYAELRKRASAVAEVVGTHVGDQRSPVCLLLGHDTSLVASLLGVLKAGAIVAPLDAAQPPARLRSVLEHCRPGLLLTVGPYEALAQEIVSGGCATRRVEDVVADARGGESTPRVSADSPACLLFTSGSTGAPKGVLHSQCNLLHRARSFATLFGVGRNDRVTWFGSAAAGQGLVDVLVAMLTGATLVPYAPRERGLAALPEWLRCERVTTFHSSATLWRSLCSLLRPGDVFDDLRTLLISSERVLVADYHAACRHVREGARFIVVYSSTETGFISAHRLTVGEAVVDASLPVGLPTLGQTVCILDEGGREVGTGELGEIAVRSRYLALGYWLGTSTDTTVFHDVPGDPLAREYRTGDRGRRRDDGAIEHHGRIDTRVKIRGHRVELGAIEDALLSHPAILQAVAICVAGPDGNDEIVACYATRPHAEVSEADLRASLAGSLPESHVPARFERRPALPVTSVGKLDRSAVVPLLAAPHDSAPRADVASPVEQSISAAWAEVIGTIPTNHDEPFLLAGGDSLRAMRLLARVAERWNVDVTVAEFFAAPTVSELSALVRSKLAQGRDSGAPQKN